MSIKSKVMFPFLLITVLALLSLVIGCSSTPGPITQSPTSPATTVPVTTAPSTTIPPTTTVPTTAPPSTSAQKPVTLNTAPGGMIAPPAQGQFGWLTLMDLIDKGTNGQVKFNVYWGQTLIAQTQISTGLQSGIVDFAALPPHMEPGKMPLAVISQKPGFGSNQWVRASAYNDLIRQDPIKAEFAKFNAKAVGVITMANAYLLTKKPVRSLADLKGLKVAASGTQSTIIAALGATPVALGAQDQYDGLSKGIVEGVCCPIDAVQSFKFYELAKYYTFLSLGDRTYPVVFNINVWNKLSPENQKIITDLAPAFPKAAYEEYAAFFDKAIKWFQDQGGEIITLSQADLDTVSQVHAADVSKWAADLEKSGQPANQTLNDYKTLIEKYEKLNPYK